MAQIDLRPALTYDDVLLEPQRSDVESRSDVDISGMLGRLRLAVPILSANMDSITDGKMAAAMFSAGGMGVLHRFVDERAVIEWMKALGGFDRCVPSVGLGPTSFAVENYREYASHICVDVAHGHSDEVFKTVRALDSLGWNVMAGNVATGAGALELAEAGANIIKVGVGPGSVCTTRLVTGHGVPQLTAVMDCHDALVKAGVRDNVHLVADGGLRNSGDVAKAIAAGADAVMTGSLFAGCKESAMPYQYRGMASREAQMDFRGFVGNATPEGATIGLEPSYQTVQDVMDEIAGGLRSALSYSGAKNLREFRENAVFRVVSTNSARENGVHFQQR